MQGFRQQSGVTAEGRSCGDYRDTRQWCQVLFAVKHLRHTTNSRRTSRIVILSGSEGSFAIRREDPSLRLWMTSLLRPYGEVVLAVVLARRYRLLPQARRNGRRASCSAADARPWPLHQHGCSFRTVPDTRREGGEPYRRCKRARWHWACRSGLASAPSAYSSSTSAQRRAARCYAHRKDSLLG